MISSFQFFTLLSLLPFLLQCHSTDHHENSFGIPKHDTASPTTYFEVTKPIKLPNTKPCSSCLLLHHDFAYTYQKPPVIANYTPPSDCPDHNFSKVVLEWNAEIKGEQIDRIFGIWLGGVEILRGSTPVSTDSGIVWTVEKDITKYSSLLKSNQTLAIYLGNVVDKTYTGTFHVNVTMHFYPSENKNYGLDEEDTSFGFDSVADLILPISRNLPLSDGLWFEINNSTDVEYKEFNIPQNAYRAVLEVYVSFHENDELWYQNLPNEFLDANNLTASIRNGPFREVVISLDGMVVGAVWPFPVVYPGGYSTLVWIPITGIGSFDLPTYDFEVTPFLGNILDGKTHKFGFSVTNALSVWNVNANLHLWLDGKSAETKGELLKHDISPLIMSSSTNSSGYAFGSFSTNVNRFIYSVGLLYSSYGAITTKATHELSYTNSNLMTNKGRDTYLEQMIVSDDQVFVSIPFSSNHFIQSINRFPLSFNYTNVYQGNNTSESTTNISLGFNQKKIEVSGSKISVSSLENLQAAHAYWVVKDRKAVQEFGSIEQAYSYNGGDKSCYSRNVKTSNHTIHFDNTSNDCNNKGLGVP